MTESSALLRLIDALPDARVLCCGDLMLDRFVYGDVERVSPEAPIPVMRVGREATMLGGVGNVARNVAALGARADVVALVGSDAAADRVTDLIGAEERLAAHLVPDPVRRTSVKTRYVAGGQQLLRADEEHLSPIAGDARGQLIDTFAERLGACDAVVLSDYAKGVLSADVLAVLIDMAATAGKPVVADPKGRDFARYRGATVLTPNRKELSAATGRACDTDQDVETAAGDLLTTFGLDSVLATRSEQGMTLVRRGESPLHIPARTREVYDVSGAGDTVVAVVGAVLAAKGSAEAAAELANLAGGVVVGKVGTAIVTAAELRDSLHVDDLLANEAKVVSRREALERAERWRARGHTVGFTNGCFDLIHPGHVSLLTQAKAACDRLVVGLNSDESVRRLKGDSRPVQAETARATVLASLQPVDLVVVFGEDTPVDLIAALKPDVLVKGADYTLDQVVGADIVHGYGGKVVLADLAAGFSTTDTIARMAGGRAESGEGDG